MVDKSEKFNLLVRIGYLSRGVLYTVLGIIALTNAQQIASGTDGVFRAIENFPAGNVILGILVVGLLAYALFRFASTFLDIENHGSDKTGIAKRIGHAGSAIGHLALAFSAYKFATSQGNVSSDGAQEAAAGILSMGLGSLILGVLGLAFFIAAIFQAKKGITGEFMHRISGAAPSYTRNLGLAGYLARAVVFLVIGISVVRSAWFSQGAEVKTLGDAVASLSGMGIGFTIVAIGLILFGIYSFVQARYRIIPDMGSEGRVPAYRA